MFQLYTLLSVLTSYIGFSLSQEDLFINNNSNGVRLNNRAPIDYQSSQSNLWLISRDEPIPESLNRQLLISDTISTDKLASSRTANDYGTLLHNPHLSEEVESLHLPPVYVSQTSLNNYDRVVTSENRRHSVNDTGLGIQNTEAVLVQLPIEATEGLWERPQTQYLQTLSTSGSQKIDQSNLDESSSNMKRDDVPNVYEPIRKLTSRLPNTEFAPQGESNIPLQQYYELPYQEFLPTHVSSSEINASSNVRTEISQPEIWSLNNDQNFQIVSGDTILPERLYETPSADSFERGRKMHDVLNVLTSEDIDLLARLGILSSLFIHPIQSESTTGDFTSVQNSQRELENKPVLIDHGGQSYLASDPKNNLTDFSEIELFDIPKFTAAQYHSNLPENIGSHYTDSPSYFPLQNVPEATVQLNESLNVQNDTNLTDRQILEILQLLSLDTADLFNLSTPISLHETKNIKNSNFERTSLGNLSLNISVPTNKNVSLNKTSEQHKATPSQIATARSDNETLQTDLAQPTNSVPTVRDGRIKPRLLESLTQRENEIIERLIGKALPVSESKVEMLRKAQTQPKPYFFGFKQDDGNGTLQHRNETSDSLGVVKGSYGYRDAMGVYRNVNYIADNSGFHAVVKTNEPGTVSHNTADAVFRSETPPLAALVKMMAYRLSKEVLNATNLP